MSPINKADAPGRTIGINTMTYTFISKNTSAVVTLSAESVDEAWKMLDQLIVPHMNDFRLDEDE